MNTLQNKNDLIFSSTGGKSMASIGQYDRDNMLKAMKEHARGHIAKHAMNVEKDKQNKDNELEEKKTNDVDDSIHKMNIDDNSQRGKARSIFDDVSEYSSYSFDSDYELFDSDNEPNIGDEHLPIQIDMDKVDESNQFDQLPSTDLDGEPLENRESLPKPTSVIEINSESSTDNEQSEGDTKLSGKESSSSDSSTSVEMPVVDKDSRCIEDAVNESTAEPTLNKESSPKIPKWTDTAWLEAAPTTILAVRYGIVNYVRSDVEKMRKDDY